jgi:hypothetical protein
MHSRLQNGDHFPDPSITTQSTGFVLDRHGRILTALYSSGAIGRLVPDDVAGFVRYVGDHAGDALAEVRR